MAVSFKNISKQSLVLFGQTVAAGAFIQVEDRLLGNNAIVVLQRTGVIRQMVDKPKAAEMPAAAPVVAKAPEVAVVVETPAVVEIPAAPVTPVVEESKGKNKGKGKKL